jgi:hypothetical protein
VIRKGNGESDGMTKMVTLNDPSLQATNLLDEPEEIMDVTTAFENLNNLLQEIRDGIIKETGYPSNIEKWVEFSARMETLRAYVVRKEEKLAAGRKWKSLAKRVDDT